MYSEAELTVLGDFARVRKARPSEILSDAMTLVAMLGGYLNRKNDGPPDRRNQWDGQIRLAQRAQMVEEMKALAGESSVSKLLRSGDIRLMGRLRLPPCSPKLNPVETVFQFLKSRHIANQVFETTDTVKEKVGAARSQFT